MSVLSAANLFNLSKQTAVVTGGATGIGLAIAQTLAINGADVYITGRRLQNLQDASKDFNTSKPPSAGTIHPLQMDVTSKTSLTETATHLATKIDTLDILVNNAGIINSTTDMSKLSSGASDLSKAMLSLDLAQDFDALYSTNVTSLYTVSAAFLPLLTAASEKRKTYAQPFPATILNITSVSGQICTTQNGQFAYNSSKAAAISMTRLLANEFCKPEIAVRVNSIAPGYFHSQMTSGHAKEPSEEERKKSDQRLTSKWPIPADRFGLPQDLASAVLTLVTNQFIMGQTIAVDGGLTLRIP